MLSFTFDSEQKLAANIPILPSQQGGISSGQQIPTVVVTGVHPQASLGTSHDKPAIQGIGQTMSVHGALSTAISPAPNITQSQLDTKEGFMASPSQQAHLQAVHLQQPPPAMPIQVQGVATAAANIQSVPSVAADNPNVQHVPLQALSQGQVIYQPQQIVQPTDISYCRVVMHHSDGSQ